MSASQNSFPARPRILRSAPPPSRRSSDVISAPHPVHQESPSTARFIWSDWWSFLSALVFVAPWALVGLLIASRGLPADWIDGSLEPKATPYFIWLGVITSLIGGLALHFRLRRLHRFFDEGVELSGVIESMMFFQDRGRVFFSFQFQHHRYQSSMALHQTRATRSLRVGQSVRVLIDPENPVRAILPAVFESKP